MHSRVALTFSAAARLQSLRFFFPRARLALTCGSWEKLGANMKSPLAHSGPMGRHGLKQVLRGGGAEIWHYRRVKAITLHQKRDHTNFEKTYVEHE